MMKRGEDGGVTHDLPVTVSEDEIWQRDAAAGEHPVPLGDGKAVSGFLIIYSTLL